MEYKHMICPCCKKEIDIPLREYSVGYNFNYSILINSIEEFFDLVDICPECGYTMLFDNGISDEMKKFVGSDRYKSILNADIEEGLKKWILYAILTEFDENYTEAGIAYTKAYDYLELKKMELDKQLIKKATSCFLSSAEKYLSCVDAFLAIDSMRRDGDMKGAKYFLDLTCENFEGEFVDQLAWKERMWIEMNQTKKRRLNL